MTVIVREGDTYSTKHLNDISLSQAGTVILLSNDIQNSTCRFGNREMKEEREKNIVLTESVIDEKTEDVPDDLQDRAAWTKAQMEKLNMMTPADM